MPNRSEQRHQSPREVPPVGRPRGAIWRALQADGVVWEGQVQLAGDDLDLAARMIVTHRRVVFVRGGEAVLDIPRDWLRPEPVMRRDGVLDLFVTMPGGNLFDEPMRVPLRMRDGYPAAGHIIAMLAPSGVRRISPDTLSGMERAREAAPANGFKSFWEDDADPLFPSNGIDGHAFDDGDPADDAAAIDAAAWPPLEPPDRVARLASTPPRRPTTNAFPITGLLPRDQRKSSWGLILRLAALTLLLATAAALGAGRLQLLTPGGESGAVLTAPTPTITATASAAETADAALLPASETAILTGVGGAAAQASDADPTATAETSAATETPNPAIAAGTPSATATTEAVIPTPAPPTAPAAEPTAAPSPTAAPNTGSGTATANVATPDAVASQPAAVAADQAPAQEIVVGPVRLVIEMAMRAETLPRYGLPPGTGEWVLLTVEARNEGEAAASLAMADFRLFDRGTGQAADLDTGTDVIASLAGFDPARTPADTIVIEPGDSAEALLLYLLPPGSSDDVALLVGEASLDLGPALTLEDATAANPPQLIPATVTDVLDGGQIAVEIDGRQETVRYLGMAAPAADACYATEATAANTQLMEGQQVWLERQASDRDDDSALLRDVWIGTTDGERALVAVRLIEAGAGTAAPAPPDTRYQAWLQAASALARTNGAGQWGACPDAAASAEVNAPGQAFLSAAWRGGANFTR